MKDVMSEAAIWEMMAEEATELSHVAQKMGRLLRGENPVSPELTKEILFARAMEEFNDLLIETDILEVKFDPFLYGEKLQRFSDRCKNIEMEDK